MSSYSLVESRVRTYRKFSRPVRRVRMLVVRRATRRPINLRPGPADVQSEYESIRASFPSTEDAFREEITHLCHNLLDDSEAAHGSSSHGSHSSSARSEPYQGLPSRYALVSPGAIQSANGAAVHVGPRVVRDAG